MKKSAIAFLLAGFTFGQTEAFAAIPFSFHTPWMNDTTAVGGGSGSYYKEDLHTGRGQYCIDFNIGSGDDDHRHPVLAIADGTVVVANKGPGHIDKGEDATGTVFDHDVKIKHTDGYSSIYMHLVDNVVNKGQSVRQGQVVGYIGDRGSAGAYHLHFCIYNSDDTSVKPTPMDGVQFEDDDASLKTGRDDGYAVTSHNNPLFDNLEALHSSMLGIRTGTIHFLGSGNSFPNDDGIWENPDRDGYSRDFYIQDHDHKDGGYSLTSVVIYDALGGARSAILLRSGFKDHYFNVCGGPYGNCNEHGVADCGPPLADEYYNGEDSHTHKGSARQEFKTCYFYWDGDKAEAHPYPGVAPGWFEGSGWNPTIS